MVLQQNQTDRIVPSFSSRYPLVSMGSFTPRIREMDELPPSEIGKVVADLAALSMHEPVPGTENVNRVDQNIDYFLRQKLVDLEVELSLIPDNKDKEAYNLASSFTTKVGGPEDYLNTEFMLKFLRCDDFDAKKAAQRLVRHFDKKRELFGTELLNKDIKLSDLSKDDMEFLLSGGFQILPSLDRANRIVWFARYPEWRFKTNLNMLRASWYLTMVTSDMVESQLNGVVIVTYNIETTNDNSPSPSEAHNNNTITHDLIRQRIKSVQCCPVKVGAIHCCSGGSGIASIILQKMYDLAVDLSAPFVRLRICLHIGEYFIMFPLFFISDHLLLFSNSHSAVLFDL